VCWTTTPDLAVRQAIERDISNSAMSDPTDPENHAETATHGQLVEVYTPLDLPDGRRFAFEVYASDGRVAKAKDQLTGQLVPFALLSLLVLALTQLPVSMWLVRRVSRAQAEHGRLLRSALTASDRERRTIARDLHDGVVQDLAGVGYALEAVSASLPAGSPDRSKSVLDTVSGVVRDATGSLRTLMVDIYPPDLTSAGLEAALTDLADPLRTRGVDVRVRVNLRGELNPETSATIYRCARECLTNVAKHAEAEVTLEGDCQRVRLAISDDGVGPPPEGVDRRAEGHVGLHLLRDAVADLGGDLTVEAGACGQGTTVVVNVPSTTS
jgi:two-component system NarL family sensor kinase